MINVVFEYLKYNRVSYSKRYINNLVESHSDFPSILSIIDSLSILGLEYQIAKFSPSRIKDLDFPYVVHRDEGGGTLEFIKSEKDLSQLGDGLKGCSGVVFKINSNTKISNVEHNEFLMNERKNSFLLLFIGMMLCISPFCVLTRGLEGVDIISLLFLFFGFFTSLLLLGKEFGLKNDKLDQFCESGKNTNCNVVIDSSISKLWFGLSITDLSFSYFLSLMIVFGITGLFSFPVEILRSFCFYLFLINVPIVLWSIYSQYVVLKHWCRLCLLVCMALLGLIFNSVVYFLKGEILVDFGILPFIILFSILFVGLLSGLLLVKDLVGNVMKYRGYLTLSRRISQSIDTFLLHLNKGDLRNTKRIQGEIFLGSEDAPVNLLIVMNLYCKPCREHFYEIRQLFLRYPHVYNIVFRFKLSAKDHGFSPTTGQYLIQYWNEKILGSDDQDSNTLDFIRDWHVTRDLQKFKKQYCLESDDWSIGISVDQQQQHWNRVEAISKTPVTFVNGLLLSGNYKVSDLMALSLELNSHFSSLHENSKIVLSV